MNELIRVNENNQTVSARDLYKSLEVKYDFKRWVESNFKLFVENTDYFRGHMDVQANRYGGEQTIVDYELSINMAEHLCLMSQTEKGKKCRQYLIDLEKAWNTPEQVMARALRLADETIKSLTNKIGTMQPKVEFFDAVTDSKDAITMADVAKVLDMGVGRNNLFKILRQERILQNDNRPYQEYIDRGYFRVVEQRYDRGYGETGINIKTLVFQKGVDFIRKTLKERGLA